MTGHKYIFKYIRKVSVETRTRAFQFKTLHNILYLNQRLHKMGLAESLLCNLCGISGETTTHMFLNCPITTNLGAAARGCGLFGLGSFVAGDLGWGFCCFHIIWCDCFGFGLWACRQHGCGCGGVVLVSFFFWETSMVKSQNTQYWASAVCVSWRGGGGGGDIGVLSLWLGSAQCWHARGLGLGNKREMWRR